MRDGGAYKLKFGASLFGLAIAFGSSPAVASPDTRADPQPDRTLTLTLPLVRDGQVFGDIVAQVDAAGGISIETQSLRSELEPLMNAEGLQALDSSLAGRPFITPAELAPIGIQLNYDASRLELQLLGMDSRYRRVERIGGAPEPEEEGEIAALRPAAFSGYLNLNTSFDYEEDRGLLAPSLFAFGAARFQNIVVEVDGAFTEEVGENYRFHRRGVRAVYDDPENYRRYSAGDLRLSTLPLMRTQFMGGVAVEKSRRVFDPFSPFSGFPGQQIFLDTPSTVEVLVNGAPYRTLQLPAGAYDFADLPLQYGANDIELVIRDQAGRERVTRLDYYFDPVDLAPGEDEYTAALGLLAREFALEAEYTSDPAFVGSYRRAFSATLLLGGGLQFSEDVQVVAAQVQITPQVIPGSFDLHWAGSSSASGEGFAARAAWRWSDMDWRTARRFTIAADYESADYSVVGEPQLFGDKRLSVSASFSQNLAPGTRLVVGATYFDGGALEIQSTAHADVVHFFDNGYRLSAGVEFGRGDLLEREFGLRFALSIPFGPRNRADVATQTRREFARASFSRASTNTVGSVGYDIGVETFEDTTSADGLIHYTGNRFEAQGFFRAGGSSSNSLSERQSASLQIGTSLAFADGSFGVGRPIDDSFALIEPHESLDDRRIIAGQDLNSGRYQAASGPFGAAVLNSLASYVPHNILYDVDNAPPGYDIGPGVARVEPPYRSGAVVEVGSENYVSAFGFLHIDGAAASLISGVITSPDDHKFGAQPFFTNSTGRFSVMGLAPGKTYVVRLNDRQESFAIDVPFEADGLYRIGAVNLQNSRH